MLRYKHTYIVYWEIQNFSRSPPSHRSLNREMMTRRPVSWILVLPLLATVVVGSLTAADNTTDNHIGVRYDSRSLIINGKRELLFSGSLHYPRITTQMWPEIIAKAKRGGLNTIQTYVFWNIHEPHQGQFNFVGNYDLVKFIREIEKQGLWVILRIGPYIQAEWNFGGLPYWLREVPDILFRTNNEPFKHHMENWSDLVVKMMKDEKLFASQGGPIILTQIENEYNNIAPAYKEDGIRYVQWAGKMAEATDTGVPWIMCKEKYAPDEVISVCNGRNCGDTFEGPNSPDKPILWTENWTAQYRVFGDPPSQRSAEDLAYSIARFFSKNGTLANYYMYHGGTNVGRTASAFVKTAYYDEAPLDSFGLVKDPKYGHLKDCHSALKLARKALLWGKPSVQPLRDFLEAYVYEKKDDNVCVAFLSNNNSRVDTDVVFRGVRYFLPHHSISILPDCRTVVFNTQRVNSQHNARTFQTAQESNKDVAWQMWQESLPTFDEAPMKAPRPQEQIALTQDTTDYLWYTTSFVLEEDDLPMRRDIRPVIQVTSLGHAMHAFVNGKFVGTGHGTKIEKTFAFQKPVELKVGMNHITLLGIVIGMPDSGVYLEHRMAGIRFVTCQGLNTGTLDLTTNKWGHQVGVFGELNMIYKEEESRKVQWSDPQPGIPLTWYKRYFDAPHGDDPVAINMSSMGKGMVWVNGNSIGRYWVSYLSPIGKPTQTMYHIHRAYLKPSGNLMVVFEESGGEPDGIVVMTVARDVICTKVSEFHPAHIKSWSRENNKILETVEDVKPKAVLRCPKGKLIQKIAFASFGNPTGACGNMTVGSCHTDVTAIVDKACLGKSSCVMSVKASDYGADVKCPETTLTLSVEARCS